MKKVLITGANGFIGSFLAEEALTQQYEVYAGIRKECNTKYLNDNRINFFELDYENQESLKSKFAHSPPFDLIIHNAGLTKAENNTDYHRVNFEYTKNIVDALIASNRKPAQFVYMSSLAAFGPANQSQQPFVKLTDTPKPITSYGKSKLASEQFLSNLSDFPTIIIRPTAVYGPREKDLLTFFKMINRNLEPYIGTQNQQFTFIFIKDLARAVFLTAASGKKNASYFVSDGRSYNREELGALIKSCLNKKTFQFSVPLPLVKLAAMLNESANYLMGRQSIFNLDKVKELGSTNWNCDIAPLQIATGFEAAYDLKKGIEETIVWYKNEGWL